MRLVGDALSTFIDIENDTSVAHDLGVEHRAEHQIVECSAP